MLSLSSHCNFAGPAYQFSNGQVGGVSLDLSFAVAPALGRITFSVLGDTLG
jgi:hypothetical protein